jgi:hypothetical protein
MTSFKTPTLIIAFFLLALLSSCGGCKTNAGLPDVKNVPTTEKKMKIDGLYVMTTDFSEDFAKGFKWGSGGMDISGKETIRFEKGRAYFVNSKIFNPGAVLFKNIKKVDDYTYSATILAGASDTYYEYKATIYNNGENLVSKTHVPDGTSFSKKPLGVDAKYYLVDKK